MSLLDLTLAAVLVGGLKSPLPLHQFPPVAFATEQMRVSETYQAWLWGRTNFVSWQGEELRDRAAAARRAWEAWNLLYWALRGNDSYARDLHDFLGADAFYAGRMPGVLPTPD